MHGTGPAKPVPLGVQPGKALASASPVWIPANRRPAAHAAQPVFVVSVPAGSLARNWLASMHTLALARAPGAALRSPSAFPVLRTLSALAAASLLACQAQAQVQQAQQAQRAQASQLDTVVVTASRSEQPLRTVTADMTVIDAETIARSGATGVADLLVQVPGVQINRNGGPGQVTSVYLRGTSNQHTAVFIDGVRYSSQELQGGAVWSTLPLAQIERIEVLRGPAAAIYGSDAMGGVIQIFTKRADGQTRAYAEAGIGNQGTSKLATGFQGGANGFTYGLNLADERSDGFDVYPGNTFSPNPDKDGYSNTSLGLNAGYKTGIHQIDASLLHSRLRTHYDQSPPPFDDYDVVKNTTGSLRWQAGWNAMYKSVVQISHTDSQSDRHTQSPESAKGRSTNYLLQNLFTLGQHRFNIDLERREDKLDTQYAWTQNTDSRRVQNSLSAGWRRPRAATSSTPTCVTTRCATSRTRPRAAWATACRSTSAGAGWHRPARPSERPRCTSASRARRRPTSSPKAAPTWKRACTMRPVPTASRPWSTATSSRTSSPTTGTAPFPATATATGKAWRPPA